MYCNYQRSYSFPVETISRRRNLILKTVGLVHKRFGYVNKIFLAPEIGLTFVTEGCH